MRLAHAPDLHPLLPTDLNPGRRTTMENRTDPIEIIAQVSARDGKQRALEVWLYKADKEGWPVTVESSSVDETGDECAVVEIESLRYQILHAKRVRRRVAIVPRGQHLIAAGAGAPTQG
ncbi:hypothetical protein ACIA3K_03510 [Micromonospora sp. NPDC051543]|uniref:hypothetical protein n=1 Tax=Micromonospora sp. NPDC051543 TaxID=3364287 RepID=UPI0037A56F88